MSQPDAYIQGDDEEESYKQELGLKKMLYKYEYENDQLRAQIRALTERLTDILTRNSEKDTPPPSVPPPQEFQLNLLKQEMRRLYGEIERVSNEIKVNREEINEKQELKCTELQNEIKKEDKEIGLIRANIDQLEKLQQMKGFSIQARDLDQSKLRINNHEQKLRELQKELEQTKKNLRDLEKARDLYDRNEVKRHSYVVGLNSQTRKMSTVGQSIREPEKPEKLEKKGGGLWHMDYSQQNYVKVKGQLSQLKREKDRIIHSLKQENSMLKQRFKELTEEAEDLNKSIHLPKIAEPRTGRVNKNKTINQSVGAYTPPLPEHHPKLLNVGPKQFERNNDKNYSPKKLRKLEWESSQHRTSGIEWNDAHLRSPITGMNLWWDGHLIGLQLLHRMGESSQHLHLISKNISPVQYRLNGNDYVVNVVLWISENRIGGIELFSKGGRKDGFGNKGKGRKYDFQISDPEKPVFSFGKFRVVNNVSEITKIGFEVI